MRVCSRLASERKLEGRGKIGREFAGIACLAPLNEWKCAGNFPGTTSEQGVRIEKRVYRCCRLDSRKVLTASADESLQSCRLSFRIGERMCRACQHKSQVYV